MALAAFAAFNVVHALKLPNRTRAGQGFHTVWSVYGTLTVLLRTAASAYSRLDPDGRARITALTRPEMALGDRGVGSRP